jgi:chaperonin GroES
MPETQQTELPPDRRGPGSGPPGDTGDTVAEYLDPGDDDQDNDDYTVTIDGEDLVVTIGEPYEPPRNQDQIEFYANLAAYLEDRLKQSLATDTLQKIEQDKEARKKGQEDYEEGIRRTGLGKDAPGGAEFEGASRAVHPGLTDACIDYEARVIKELMPPAGPVKQKIVGVATRAKTERAKRKVEHMNWQITTQIKEGFSVLETMFTQVPLAGAQYVDQTWDHRLGRPRWEYIPKDRCHYPFGAANWHSANRRTVERPMSAVDYKHKVKYGVYIDLDFGETATRPEQTPAEKASDRVQGKDEPALNIDGDRTIFETTELIEIDADLAQALQDLGGDEQEGDIRPFMISIDEQTREMCAMYRCWEEDDDTYEPIEHTFEFPFIYWRGGNVGLPHIIGTLSGAATGSLRALLDSAHIANAATGVMLKGSGTRGQTVRPNIGELTEIDRGLEVDDIRKLVMEFPGKGPSPVLFQLLGFLTDALKNTVRTSLDEVASDQSPNTPVGTTMARLEEGMTVFSAIHRRVHASFNRLLMGLHRLNRLYLPDRLAVDDNGREILVYRRDYEGPCNIEPTSDPTIYSDQQRFAQVTAVQQRAQVLPQVYKIREVEMWFLKWLKIPDPEQFLQDIPQPHELNAVNENLSLLMGKPVVAFPDQDHAAHLEVLMDFMQAVALNPGSPPMIAQKFLPGAMQHAVEHIGYLYVGQTTDLIQQAAGRDVVDLMSSDDKVKQRFDQLLAVASKRVIPQYMQMIARAMPLLQKAQQLLSSMQPQAPMDPAAMAAQAAAMAETKRKTTADQASAQNDQQRNALLAEQNEIRREQIQVESATKIATTSADNQTAEDISTQRLNRGQAPGFTTGESMVGA